MGVNDYNVGSDTTLTIVAAGQVVRSAILTTFEARQITTRLKSTAIDGKNRYRELEEGWEGTLGYDRADSIWDDLIAAKEAARYKGQGQPVVTITETTTNAADGSVVKYRYSGVTLKMDTIGAREGDKKVEQRLSWAASRRIKVL